MAKGYWINYYKSISDTAKVQAYAQLAGPACEAGGGRFIVRGPAVKAYEAGILERVVIVEFPSVAAAIAAHDSPAYQAALKVLDGAAERDMRFVEGVE
jgi:uncharacterized protein (DUF1330 family)